MIIITAPSKTLDLTSNYTPVPESQPLFIDATKRLHKALSAMTKAELTHFLHVSDTIGTENYTRMQRWSSEHTLANSKPSIFLFHGDIFKSMNVQGYTRAQLAYSQEHLLILDGLYGALRGLDVCQPHRLEMKSKSPIERSKSLYSFWRAKITEYLTTALSSHQEQYIVNLASKEYSDVIDRKALPYPVIDIQLLQEKNGIRKTIAIYAKQARGLFIDYCITGNAQNLADIQKFNRNGYTLVDANKTTLTFVTKL